MKNNKYLKPPPSFEGVKAVLLECFGTSFHTIKAGSDQNDQHLSSWPKPPLSTDPSSQKTPPSCLHPYFSFHFRPSSHPPGSTARSAWGMESFDTGDFTLSATKRLTKRRMLGGKGREATKTLQADRTNSMQVVPTLKDCNQATWLNSTNVFLTPVHHSTSITVVQQVPTWPVKTLKSW